MQQIVDLQNNPEFQSLNVALVSVSTDSPAEQVSGASEYNITGVPMLVDSDKNVSEAYDILKWSLPSGEPGHTFILISQDGTVAWIKDYGAPDNPDRTMYVPIEELAQAVRTNLK